MTAPVAEARSGEPRLADATPLEARKLLDLEEWVFFTSVLGWPDSWVAFHLGFSERRVSRYRAFLRAHPEMLDYFRANPLGLWDTDLA